MRVRRLLTCSLLLALAAAPPALAGNGGFAPVPPESPNAESISQSYWFITILVVAIFVLVESLLIAFVVRYRRRRRPREAEGAPIHGSTKLELTWTVGPVLVLFAIAAFVLAKLPGIVEVPASSAAGPTIDVKVTGQQFAWQFEYENGVLAFNTLRAPAGQPVRLLVTAPTWDVVHSWWVPALGGKIDAIPGVENETWFQVDDPGTYRGQCAELCGVQHARMLGEVEVMPKAEFDAWLAEREAEQAAGTSPLGQEMWEGVCATCHGLEAEGLIGPAIGPSTLTNEEQIETIVREGRNEMPPVGRDWSGEQLNALEDYLEELAGDQQS